MDARPYATLHIPRPEECGGDDVEITVPTQRAGGRQATRLTSKSRWPGTAVTIRYEIELWAGRWFVRDKRFNSRHGPFASCQDAHDVLLDIGDVLAQADLHIMRLLGEPLADH